MDHPQPTTRGFFWAMLVTPYDEPKDEDWKSRNWEPVEVIENGGTGDEELGVLMPGIPIMQWPRDFIWGPPITPPVGRPREVPSP
jgi:hypothetical protein